MSDDDALAAAGDLGMVKGAGDNLQPDAAGIAER